MICSDCSIAADQVTAAREKSKPLTRDELKTIKELHSFCAPTHCDCQHKIPVIIPQQRIGDFDGDGNII